MNAFSRHYSAMPTFAEPLTILIVLLGSIVIRYATCSDAKDSRPPLLEAVQTAPHRHTCRYCRQICITMTRDVSTQKGLLIQLDLTFQQVVEVEACACPLLERAHNASTAAISERIRSHLQTFFDIFSTSSNLHALTGCNTFAARAHYFARGLSNQPFHLRLGHFSSETGGVLRARVLYTSWRLFEFNVSADQGEGQSPAVIGVVDMFSDDPAADYVVERPITMEPVSQQGLTQARKWLHECHRDRELHPDCAQDHHEFVPARLIEIQQHVNGSIVLHILQTVQGQRLEWASLSYCWGGDQPAKTTRANITTRLDTLSLAELPRTIRDAIHVTAGLQIHYLWIDALCIIQDDADDVAHEIATMPEVYTYCACTISASRASTSEEGFLQGHEIDSIHHNSVSMRVKLLNGATGRINLSNPGSEYRYAQEPIHKRAWCYQERILSPRIIDFGHTQITYHCKSKRIADGGRVDRAAPTDQLLVGSLKGLSQRGLINTWSNVVWKYSRRDITFAGDGLLAISAIAAYFAPLVACDYVAGHWRDMLALQLAWIAGEPKYSLPSVYVAPSWSWASISDSVYWDMNDERVPAVEIIDCQVQLTRPSAPFGAVSGGFVKLRGRIREMTWYFNRNNKQVQVEAGNISFMADRATAEDIPDYEVTLFQGMVGRDALRPDWSQDPEDRMEVSCLKLRERSQKGDTLCIFLVPALDTPGAFRRVACFRMVDALYRDDPPLDIPVFSDCVSRDVIIF